MDPIGTTIEGCQILEKIGQGTMGVVYEARQTALDRLVAVKFLAPHLCEDQDFCQRFMREARAAAKLNHPNVLQIHSVGKAGGRLYMITELVQGRSLKELVGEKGPLPEAKALEILRQIASALLEAEKQHIVHRDLKPENIMLTQDGTAKVMDFGLAKDLYQQDLTVPGMLMGTPCYMSPEQIQGERIDHRTDIYSLGLVLFYLVTGRNAFGGKTLAEVLNAHLKGRLPDLAGLCPGLSPCTRELFRRMAARAPEERPQTNAQVLEEIVGCLAALKRHGGLGPRGTRGPKPTRGAKWSRVAGLVALVAFLFFAGASALLFLKGHPLKAPWEHETRDKVPSTLTLHDYLSKGQAQLRDGEYDKAVQTFQEAAKRFPGEAGIAMWIQMASKEKARVRRQAILRELVSPPRLLVLMTPFSRFCFTDPGGDWKGLNVEVLQGFCKEYGLGFTPIARDGFKDLIPGLLQDQGDLIGAPFTMTRAREKKIAFSTPYFTNTEVLVVREDSHIGSVEDLKGMTLGYLPGTTLEKTAMEISCRDRVPFEDTRSMAMALEKGIIDAFVDDFTDALVLPSLYPGIAIGPQVAQVEFYGFGLRKSAPTLKAALDEYITRMKASGQYKRIYTRYFPGGQETTGGDELSAGDVGQ